MIMESPRSQEARTGPVCVYCQAPIGGTETPATCPACEASHHIECWDENRGCAVYGCTRAGQVEPRTALEIPISYWGREQKPCPACREMILAAALRCRHCGAIFDSARPESTSEFRRQRDAKQLAPGLRNWTRWLFVLCLFTPTAPLAALFGALWYRARRDALESIPPVYSALARLAIAIALGQTTIIAVLAIVYAVKQGT